MSDVCRQIWYCALVLLAVSLFKHRKQRNQLRARSSNDISQSRVEIRVTFTLAFVIVVFIACWLSSVVIIYGSGKALAKRQGVAFMWMRALTLSNSAMNFLIYGSWMHDLPRGIRCYWPQVSGYVDFENFLGSFFITR